MAKKQFKAESKRLLDLMINSIYTHKEIFLRELISNASDAMDKLYYHSLSEDRTGISRDEFVIRIAADKDARTLTISDNGIGMTKEQLEENLGTIAHSDTRLFREQTKDDDKLDDVDIIGQFGVGFYAAFMVADSVTVTSRAFGSDQAYEWSSNGADGYTVREAEKDTPGTDIVLHFKENTEDENYDEFLTPYRVAALVKKYSDYIRYPIQMEMPHQHKKEDTEDEYETVYETETLNSMVPIWKRNKNELTDEDYHQFYKEKFADYEDPALVIHSSTEGAATYHALLFVPSRAPYNYYTRDFEKGLALYASGVLIMDRCADLLPDCFSFVRGLVDSQDLSLNISREMLQHDRQLQTIASHLKKKIQRELYTMLQNKREDYEKFFKNFGLQLKYGVYNNFGQDKELLQDLLLFENSASDKPTTLAEYVAQMPEDQTCIYYACGESREKLDHLPQTELVRDKGYEILYLTQDVDEFAIRMMQSYQEKTFKSVSDGDLGLESEEEKEKQKKQTEENKDMFTFMKESLDGKVTDVRLSSRLKTHPVCLSSEGGLTLEMEKVLASMPGSDAEQIKASRILEINENHPIFKKLTVLYDTDKDRLKDFTALLYDQALLIEGFPVDDPVAFSARLCDLMTADLA